MNMKTKQWQDTYKSRVKFYADTPKDEKNKFFCWQVNSISDAEELLLYFLKKKFIIRAAWFENINVSTGEVVDNLKYDTVALLDKYCAKK